MARPKPTRFTKELEVMLALAWGSYSGNLNDKEVKKTRSAISKIRQAYRFEKNSSPSRIPYKKPASRAGYLGSFGERHAYLSYLQMKRIEASKPKIVPQPDDNGVLTITLIGAGAALETYGVCLFYNERRQKIRRLRVNLVDKIEEWEPVRSYVFGRALKGTFPRIDFYKNNILADIKKNCVPKFAEYHDDLINTDIILLYNVLNEIEAKNSSNVFKNLNYILRQCVKPLLVLIAEPTEDKARPRVDWLRKQLAQCSKIIVNGDDEFEFDEEPVKIEFEGREDGLNERLFKRRTDASNPRLEKTLKRNQLACVIEPISPVPWEKVLKQLSRIEIGKRRKTGRMEKQQELFTSSNFYPKVI